MKNDLELTPDITAGVVVGSDLVKITSQLEKSVITDYDYMFPENGLVANRDRMLIGTESLKSFIADGQLREFINSTLYHIADLDIPIKRCAVVTGANKGIGLEICRQLASEGILVVLTSRDKNKGLAGVERLRKSGLSNVIFHQVDVTNPTTISSLAEFIKSHFGKLDILVNNAGILGAITDAAGFTALLQVVNAMDLNKDEPNLEQVITDTYELAEECLQTNYYGVKSVTKALIPLLQLSDSPRIVNVSSRMGKMKNISNEKALEMLSDGDGLKEERVDEIVNMFLKDFKEDFLKIKGWPAYIPAYTISKVCLNAYTRILAREFPTFRINCVSPGSVKSDISYNAGVFTTAEGAERVVKLAIVSKDGPSGLYFNNGEVTPF